MIHSATLLHDDVVDMSEIRRGKKTANALWDNKASILVGDYLFSLSFQLMVKSQNLAILDLLAKTSSIIADGEILQLQNSTNIDLTEEKYFEIIFGKTAVLFSACCEVGALLNNRPKDEIEALRLFGKYLGMVFQIVDDILDYSSDESTLGKDIGNDFFEGKVTLPIIKTYQKADFANKKLINDMFANNFQQSEKNQNDFIKICDLINKFDGINEAKKSAKSLANQALEQLNIFPDNVYKNYLSTILEYSLQRIF
jgi:octaprenyl-diphosphate synthase